ncbi:hypothetical protein AEYBE204_03895 [Asticcacaulis sp. YBE204]|nr:hypothetical protein AEYBE204_03895 [Asticcacaulis sp. YBE204]
MKSGPDIRIIRARIDQFDARRNCLNNQVFREFEMDVIVTIMASVLFAGLGVVFLFYTRTYMNYVVRSFGINGRIKLPPWLRWTLDGGLACLFYKLAGAILLIFSSMMVYALIAAL